MIARQPRPITTPNVISSNVESFEVGGQIRYRLTIEHGLGCRSVFVFDLEGFGNLMDQSAGAITLALLPKGSVAA